MKVRFKGRDLELWKGASGNDLLTPEEQAMVEAGELALLEEQDGWVGLGGALRNDGKYSLLDAKLARLRLLPSVNCVLANPDLVSFPRKRSLIVARKVLDDLRIEIQTGKKLIPQTESIVKTIILRLGEAEENKTASAPAWLNPKVRLLQNPFASLTQALLSISNQGKLALPRQQLIESDGQRVGDCIQEAGWVALPLGTINHCKISDFMHALGNGIDALAFLAPDSYEIAGFTSNVRPRQLAVLASKEDLDFLYYPGKIGNDIAQN